MSPREQNIRIIPDTLTNLVVAVDKEQYRIPSSNANMYGKSKVIELFDSIYKEFPIGSFFVWKAGREHNHLFRHFIHLSISPIRDDDNDPLSWMVSRESLRYTQFLSSCVY